VPTYQAAIASKSRRRIKALRRVVYSNHLTIGPKAMATRMNAKLVGGAAADASVAGHVDPSEMSGRSAAMHGSDML
jgi:hypothetical protein